MTASHPQRALLSVSDKTGIIELAQGLALSGVEIISTGGTAKTLIDAGISITAIESVTQNPEAFGGRMKTISFQIGSALLYRRDHPGDQAEAIKLGIQPIDLVVCNLYPFEKVVQQQAELFELIENIDIGGPTMIRAAAKNYTHVSCLTDPSDYPAFLKELQSQDGITLATRERLALKTFARVAAYDLAIASELEQRIGTPLRYGENPGQKAGVLALNSLPTTLTNTQPIQGKALSYNNYLDADQAFQCCSELAENFNTQSTAVIVKHGIPCGVATHADSEQALHQAWESDSTSAFGSVVALSFPVTDVIASFFQKRFVEVILAPEFTSAAREILSSKKNLRLLELPLRKQEDPGMSVRSIHGGLLIQDEDRGISEILESVTEAKLTSSQTELAHFGLIITKYLKSNCIGIFSKSNSGFVSLTSGVGQPNRLDCITRLSGPKAKEQNLDLKDAILVSDAFFPFRDSIDAAHSIGIRTIIQPGGSVRDPEVIEACNEFKIAMAFTGRRHFRH